ncbi:MAG: hypothetical protein U1E60_24500 [Reyranellaceae bacterium]
MAPSSKPVAQKDAERAERLAAALRDNLRRRKAQARSQAERQMAERETPGRAPVDGEGTDG